MNFIYFDNYNVKPNKKNDERTKKKNLMKIVKMFSTLKAHI